MIFRMKLDGLVTHSTAGSGRGASETRQREPLGGPAVDAVVDAAARASKPARRPPSYAYKALGDPPSLEYLFRLAQFVVYHPPLSLS
jgi:hypothetical protein